MITTTDCFASPSQKAGNTENRILMIWQLTHLNTTHVQWWQPLQNVLTIMQVVRGNFVELPDTLTSPGVVLIKSWIINEGSDLIYWEPWKVVYSLINIFHIKTSLSCYCIILRYYFLWTKHQAWTIILTYWYWLHTYRWCFGFYSRQGRSGKICLQYPSNVSTLKHLFKPTPDEKNVFLYPRVLDTSAALRVFWHIAYGFGSAPFVLRRIPFKFSIYILNI